nr:pyrokinin-1 receptor-like [Onthophagus taurus]
MENFTNESLYVLVDYGPKRDSLYIVIPITVLYAIIFISGLTGNISTCIVIAKNKTMHTATNYYLFSLSISDLLLLVSGLPQEMYQIWSRYPYVFGYTFCLLRGFFSETSANATVLTITAFTVERYVAICHPFLSHTMAKLSRITKMIVFIWLVAIGFAIPQALQLGVQEQIYGDPETIQCLTVYPIIEHSFEVSTFLFFCAPMTLITVLYVLIAIKLKNSTNMLNRDSSDSRRSGGNIYICPNRKHHNNQSSRRVLKMLVAVVVAFFICWAPFHAQRLFAIYVTPPSDSIDKRRIYLKIYEIMTYISGVLYYVSTTINPVLYNIMSNKFREAFKETFSQWCCWKCCDERLEIGQQRSYAVVSKSANRIGKESTDSGREDGSVHTNTTLVHKNSVGSSTSKSRKRSYESSHDDDDQNVVSMSWTKSRSNVKLTVAPKTDYENVQPNTKLVSVQILNPVPQRPLTKFVRLFHCLAKMTWDEEKRTQQGATTAITTSIGNLKKGNVGVVDDGFCPEELSSLASGEISNSSLKNIDGGSFKDEVVYVLASR